MSIMNPSITWVMSSALHVKLCRWGKCPNGASPTATMVSAIKKTNVWTLNLYTYYLLQTVVGNPATLHHISTPRCLLNVSFLNISGKGAFVLEQMLHFP